MTKTVETTDAASSSATTYVLGIGDFFEGNITAGDSDWLKLSLQSGVTYTFAMAGIGVLANSIQDAYLTLRNSSGNALVNDDSSGPSEYATLTYTATKTGTFYLQARGYDSGDNSIGHYEVSALIGEKATYDIDMAAGALFRDDFSWVTTPATPASLTWAARDSDSGSIDAQGRSAPFAQLTAPQVAAVQAVLANYADVCGLTFTQVNPGGTSNNATLLVSDYYSTTDGAGAYAQYPGPVDYSGDVHLNTRSVSTTSLPYGSYSYFAILHEFGHTFGLEHPGDYNAAPGVSITYEDYAPYMQDSRQYSVMSYFDGTATGATTTQYAETLMMADIYALQQMYGANTATRAGDTVYGFNSNAGDPYDFSTNDQPVLCIWDGGGNDTLDVSLYADHQAINLNAGAFSDLLGFVGNVSIAYGVTLENAVGGSGADSILGNAAANQIFGGAGDDIITGALGDDQIFGGSGNDTVTVSAGDGNDAIDGGDGDDLLVLDRSTSAASYNFSVVNHALVQVLADGTSIVNVEQLNFHAGSGADLVRAGDLADTLDGGSGNDLLYGGGGGDTVLGGLGNDTLTGGLGDDSLQGGAGNDTLIGSDGADTLSGGDGNDTTSYSGAHAALVLSLADASQNTGEAAGDVYISIENLTGSAFDDVITGNDAVNTLKGGGGNDVITGGLGNDKLYGSDGADTMTGGEGNDTLYGENGADIFVFAYNSGKDTVKDFNIAEDTFAFVKVSFGIIADAIINDYVIIGGADRLPSPDTAHGYFLVKDTGIYWDEDGKGGLSATYIATINASPGLDMHNFIFV